RHDHGQPHQQAQQERRGEDVGARYGRGRRGRAYESDEEGHRTTPGPSSPNASATRMARTTTSTIAGPRPAESASCPDALENRPTAPSPAGIHSPTRRAMSVTGATRNRSTCANRNEA